MAPSLTRTDEIAFVAGSAPSVVLPAGRTLGKTVTDQTFEQLQLRARRRLPGEISSAASRDFVDDPQCVDVFEIVKEAFEHVSVGVSRHRLSLHLPAQQSGNAGRAGRAPVDADPVGR